MGCGCKSNETNDFEHFSANTETKSFNEKVNEFFQRKNKFSFIGLIFFIIATPIFIAILLPIMIVLLFNKLVMGVNTDITKLLIFKKNKIVQ
jgi:hypothetical protein